MAYTSIPELHERLKNRTLTAKNLLDIHFSEVDQWEPKLHASLEILKTQAYEKADLVDAEFDKGAPMPLLAGIPIAIKDNICMSGIKTTCASKILENFISPYNATVIEKLNAQHMIPMLKTNMDEFAMGSSTENSAFGATRNPWDLSRAPGGSSGGSAAVVAAGEVPLSLGSDTGGSIRQPASFCGVVGIKPTYGRVSRYGLVAFASSLDQIGPFSRSVEDGAHLLQALCGHDVHDATSSQNPVPDFSKSLTPDVKGLKIGVPKELFGSAIADDVKQALVKALDLLTAQGARWEEVSMGSFEAGLSTYYILAPAEASANLSRFDGVRYGHRNTSATSLKEMFKKSRGEGFGPEVIRRIILGTFVLSSGYYDAYYLKAQKARTLIQEDFKKAFSHYDLLLTPTAPTTAFKLGENADNPLAMYLADIATIPVNLAGLPAMSIPCGFSNGLPIGLQLIGKAFDEATMLRAGYTYQTLTDHHLKRPLL